MMTNGKWKYLADVISENSDNPHRLCNSISLGILWIKLKLSVPNYKIQNISQVHSPPKQWNLDQSLLDVCPLSATLANHWINIWLSSHHRLIDVRLVLAHSLRINILSTSHVSLGQYHLVDKHNITLSFDCYVMLQDQPLQRCG